MARGTAGGRGTLGQYAFSQVPTVSIPRSSFNRSHGLKTSFDPGYLIPILADEALPGDTFTCRMNSFVRLSTPIYPLMENVFLDFFFFAIPYRLVWDNWARFNGEKPSPGYATTHLVPQMTENPANGSLSDYLGIPVNGVNVTFNSLHHRAYNLCFNEWFRSQDLTDSAVVDLDDGPDTPGDYVLRRRTKRHDYFTSCLPFTQKGDPVLVQITGGGTPTMYTTVPGSPTPLSNVGGQVVHTGANGNLSWGDPALEFAVNEMRLAVQTQRLLERDARGGSRLTEIVRSHFGVVSPDQRMQRPEYIGGGSARVNVHPVARVGGTGTTANLPPVANLGGFATAIADGVGFMKSFSEHCLILGLVAVRTDITYQQGLERLFSRQTRYDFYWPAFAHLGEQAVLNKEIYYQGAAADNNVFGYQERWAEYRYKPSRTSGRMRSTYATPLDQWHLGLEFGSLPVLNNTFIEENAPWDRVVAVTTDHKFFGDFWFEMKCARPMPVYSVPGLMDHF